MKIRLLFAFLLFLHGCQVQTPPSPSRGARRDSARFAVLPSMRKIFPDTIPQGEPKAVLYAAIDEYVSFQIALRSDEELTLPVSCSIDDAEIFEALFIETPLVAQWGYPENFPEHRRGSYPDPLIPVERIRLEPGKTKSLWVRLKTRESLQGNIRIGDIDIPIILTALPFEIPEQPTIKTAIGLGGPGFASCHQTTQNSDAYWDVYEKYYQALLDYRLTGYRPPRGIKSPQSVKYLEDKRVITFVHEYSGNRDEMGALRDHVKSLGAAHKGWFYNLDEPETIEDYVVAKGQIEYLRKVFDDFLYGLTFFTGAPDKSTPFDHLAGWVNLWIIQTDYFHHSHGLGDKIRDQARDRKEAGDEIWLYTALAPRGGWCNILLNHTALEHRILFWQLYAEEIVSGYIFWHSTYWDQVQNPWEDQATVKRLDPGLWGDGSLFYPGKDAPFGSIRLELIREGLQDWELLKMAEAKKGRAEVMNIVTRVTRSFTDYTDDPEVFAQARRELENLLSSPDEISSEEGCTSVFR